MLALERCSNGPSRTNGSRAGHGAIGAHWWARHPNFTRDFVAEQGMSEQPAPFSRFDGLSVVLVGMAAVAWIVQPQAMVTG